MRSSNVSSMATIRSSSGSSSMSALSNVVLPLPVPPLTRIFRRVWRVRSAAWRMCLRQRAVLHELRRRRRIAVPNRRTVMATYGTGRRDADRHARAVPQAGIEHRAWSPGPDPRGRAMWIAARSSAAASRSWGGDLARSRPWPSSQTFPGPLIMISLTSGSSSAASKPRQKWFQQVQPVALCS